MPKPPYVHASTLKVGDAIMTPDWESCRTWPGHTPGWDGVVTEIATGRIAVRRVIRKEGATSELILLAPETEVIRK